MSASRIRWSRRTARAFVKATRVAELAEAAFERSRNRLWLRLLALVAPRTRAELDRRARAAFQTREKAFLHAAVKNCQRRAVRMPKSLARTLCEADSVLREADAALGGKA